MNAEVAVGPARADRPQTRQPSAEEFAQFIDEGYGRILDLATTRYSFEPYGTAAERPHALWRHDVDMSVHRAVAMADAEASRGLAATYFFRCRSDFYNVFEPTIARLVRRIGEMGHAIGLHFEADAPCESIDSLEAQLDEQRVLLETVTRTTVTVFSFHNPEVTGLLAMDAEQYAGMRNTYAASLRRDYTYVSDSNGYWRFTPLEHVLRSPSLTRIHVLTHPEWWTPHPMAPRDRIVRCVDGRARAVLHDYDDVLRRSGRLNITGARS